MRSTCFLLFLIAFSSRTWSGEDADKPAIDKQAEDVLRAATKFYSGLTSFRTAMTFTSKLATNGMNMEIKMAYDLAVQSPNKFTLAAKEGILKKNSYCDGKTLTT